MSTLTVIIPTRNMASTLGRAIESVLAADEIIVVDDASDDDTEAVAKGFPGVAYIRHPEKTRDHNAAQRDIWLGVKSNQIVGLAADDWLYPGAIEAMKSCADAPAVFTDNDMFDDDGRYIGGFFHHFYGRKSAKEVRNRMITHFGSGETGFACAIRADMSNWLWHAGWDRLGPMMDSVGLAAVAAIFGATYMSVKGGAFTIRRAGSYGRNPKWTADDLYEMGSTAVSWMFSVGLDATTVKAIAGKRCCMNPELLESIDAHS